jgi:hypothetical protein
VTVFLFGEENSKIFISSAFTCLCFMLFIIFAIVFVYLVTFPIFHFMSFWKLLEVDLFENILIYWSLKVELTFYWHSVHSASDKALTEVYAWEGGGEEYGGVGGGM